MISIKWAVMGKFTVNGFAYKAMPWNFWKALEEAKELKSSVMTFQPEIKPILDDMVRIYGAKSVRDSLFLAKTSYIYIRFFNWEWFL